jgi:hypothetical protein
VLWAGTIFIATGLGILALLAAPILVRLFGVAFIVPGGVMIARRGRKKETQRDRFAVIDRSAGTVTLNVSDEPPLTVSLPALRRLVLLTHEEGSALTLDFYDRPGVTLLAGAPKLEEVLTERFASAFGCPVERR